MRSSWRREGQGIRQKAAAGPAKAARATVVVNAEKCILCRESLIFQRVFDSVTEAVEQTSSLAKYVMAIEG